MCILINEAFSVNYLCILFGWVDRITQHSIYVLYLYTLDNIYINVYMLDNTTIIRRRQFIECDNSSTVPIHRTTIHRTTVHRQPLFIYSDNSSKLQCIEATIHRNDNSSIWTLCRPNAHHKFWAQSANEEINLSLIRKLFFQKLNRQAN